MGKTEEKKKKWKIYGRDLRNQFCRKLFRQN